MIEQLAGHARVLAGDQIGGGENLEGAQRDVAQVPNRRRDDIEPGGQCRRRDGLSGHHIAPRSALARLLRPQWLAGLHAATLAAAAAFVCVGTQAFDFIDVPPQYEMVPPGRAAPLSRVRPEQHTRRAFGARIAILAAFSLLVAACSGMPGADYFSFGAPPPPPPAQPSAVGAGQVKVALLLPLSAQGNGAA